MYKIPNSEDILTEEELDELYDTVRRDEDDEEVDFDEFREEDDDQEEHNDQQDL